MVQLRPCLPGLVRAATGGRVYTLGTKCTWLGCDMLFAKGVSTLTPICFAFSIPFTHSPVPSFSYGDIIAVRHSHDHGRLARDCEAQRNGSHGRRHQTRLLALLRRQTLDPVPQRISGGIYVLGGKHGTWTQPSPRLISPHLTSYVCLDLAATLELPFTPSHDPRRDFPPFRSSTHALPRPSAPLAATLPSLHPHLTLTTFSHPRSHLTLVLLT